MRPYPKLMCSKTNPSELIIYFANPNAGMVLHSTVEEFPMGTLDLHWRVDFFEDVSENVVVWLTEGPHEPIIEAIAMVDKIHIMRDAEEANADDK